MLYGADIDELNMYPLQQGKVLPSSAAMKKLKHLPEERQKIFLIDKHYEVFRDNKVKCRLERLGKYYQVNPRLDMKKVLNFLFGTLLDEYPEYFRFYTYDGWVRLRNVLTDDWVVFDEELKVQLHGWGDPRLTGYELVDLFDWFAMQVPCDMVVFSDKADALHLMSPSGWSAEGTLWQTFSMIHKDVKKANGQHVIRSAEKMVDSLRSMNGAVERVGAISFRSTWELNRHPENRPEDSWTWGDDQQVYLRFERQTVMPLGDYFLFTIRSYYNDLTRPDRIEAAIRAVADVHKNAYPREFLAEHGPALYDFLKRRLATIEADS